MMRVEKFNYTEIVFWTNPEDCKTFVKRHRNIFDKSTRVYIENTYPVVIKEISTAPDGNKQYWYWVFYPDYYKIYQFDKKPSKKEWSKMWQEILDSVEPLNARILHKNEEVRK